VNATNGIACQVTMIVATKKKESGWMSHECPMKSTPVTLVSSQLITPRSVSNIQPHTTLAVRAGIAHASSSPTETSSLNPLPSLVIRNAIEMPSSIVRTTFARQNATLRPSTSQNSTSVRTAR
jgi:hypothetical protein